MDRRAFLLLALAGAADPAPFPPLQPGGQLGTTGDTLAPDNTDEALNRFNQWRSDFMIRAIADGLPADVLSREFAGLTPDPHILALQTHQPEFSKPISAYVQGVVSEARVTQGQDRLAALTWLPSLEARFGVPAEILVSIWAVETNFGAIQGDFDVLRSLATLAAAGLRQDWAEGQIIAVIRIIASGEATRAQLHGSWAGALGQTQFEPSQYLALAVDGDGDGRRDIWGSAPDALASAANLLAMAGWRRGERWQREMILPAGFDYGLTEGPVQPLAAWTALGARTADGLAWNSVDAAEPAMLVTPAGAQGPAFLLLPNHFVLRQYNNALAYALAVGLLADRMTGRPGLVTPWPQETPLSIDDRMAAQSALTQLGFDAGAADGLIGAKTRAALRAWQQRNGLTADGYLSPAVVWRLRQAVTPPSVAPNLSPQQPAAGGPTSQTGN